MVKLLSPAQNILKLLFKEVLQRTTPEIAEKLVNGLKDDHRNLRIIIGENSRGRGYKCAFQWGFWDDNDWRGIADEGIHLVQ